MTSTAPALACVFDAYGTLFDIAAPANASRTALGDKAAELTGIWRRKQLEYTWLRSLMGRHADFWQVTSDALDYALAAVHRAAPAIHRALLDSYLALEAYSEVPATLAALRERGMRTAILSNGTAAMLEAACRHNRMAALFDDILSVDAVGIFKPHPSVYRYATDRLAVRPDEILFMSSNGWDIAGAASFGFRTVWVNRSGQPPERLPGTPVAVIDNLSELLAHIPARSGR